MDTQKLIIGYTKTQNLIIGYTKTQWLIIGYPIMWPKKVVCDRFLKGNFWSENRVFGYTKTIFGYPIIRRFWVNSVVFGLFLAIFARNIYWISNNVAKRPLFFIILFI